ncbi:MAG: hypothetical protein RSE94_08270 [Pseudomonas sp.]
MVVDLFTETYFGIEVDDALEMAEQKSAMLLVNFGASFEANSPKRLFQLLYHPKHIWLYP